MNFLSFLWLCIRQGVSGFEDVRRMTVNSLIILLTFRPDLFILKCMRRARARRANRARQARAHGIRLVLRCAGAGSGISQKQLPVSRSNAGYGFVRGKVFCGMGVGAGKRESEYGSVRKRVFYNTAGASDKLGTSHAARAS